MLSHKKSLDISRKTNALLEGHFVLSSGLHSSKYIQCAKLLSFPHKAEKICKSLAGKIKKKFNIFPRIIFGFLSGLISAPMGITGAMMNVPILRYFGYPINLAIGSSAAIGFIIALFGSIGFFTSGLMLKADIPLSIGFINIPAFIIFVPITTFMARIGAKTVQDLDRVKTQRLFGVFLYVIGTLFLYRFLVT